MKNRYENILSIIRSSGADEEEMTELEALSKPDSFESKYDLGEKMDEFFGYDPVSYHERMYLENSFDDIVKRAPESMRTTLRDSKDEIIDGVMEHKKALDEEYLYQILLAKIFADTGWMPEEEKVNMSSAIYDEVAGVSFPLDEEDDEDEDSDTEEDDEPIESDDEDGDTFDFE